MNSFLLFFSYYFYCCCWVGDVVVAVCINVMNVQKYCGIGRKLQNCNNNSQHQATSTNILLVIPRFLFKHNFFPLVFVRFFSLWYLIYKFFFRWLVLSSILNFFVVFVGCCWFALFHVVAVIVVVVVVVCCFDIVCKYIFQFYFLI